MLCTQVAKGFSGKKPYGFKFSANNLLAQQTGERSQKKTLSPKINFLKNQIIKLTDVINKANDKIYSFDIFFLNILLDNNKKK